MVPNFFYRVFAHYLGRYSKFVWPEDDKKYLSLLYYLRTHEKLNLETPTNFTQKMQWLKIYDRKDIYTEFVDKYQVRKIVEDKIGSEYLIPLLGVWDDFDEIDFEKLPNEFVLKTTHDSGGVIICRNKSTFNYKLAKKKIQKKLRNNFFWIGREYPYKGVRPRIVAEKLMVDESGTELKDYKFFCYNGIPKILFLASGRFSHKRPYFDFYDVETKKRLDISAKGHPHSDIEEIIVPNFDKMIDIARSLSKGFPFIRIDLYNINGEIFFGEYTFYHDSGFVPFLPNEWNKKLGDWIILPTNIMRFN